MFEFLNCRAAGSARQSTNGRRSSQVGHSKIQNSKHSVSCICSLTRPFLDSIERLNVWMFENQVKRDTCTYNTLMDAHTRGGNFPAVLHSLEMMTSDDVQPDVISFTQVRYSQTFRDSRFEVFKRVARFTYIHLWSMWHCRHSKPLLHSNSDQTSVDFKIQTLSGFKFRFKFEFEFKSSDVAFKNSNVCLPGVKRGRADTWLGGGRCIAGSDEKPRHQVI